MPSLKTPKDDISFLRSLYDTNVLFSYHEHSIAKRNANAFIMGMHIHPNAEILLVTKGRVEIRIAGREKEIIEPMKAALFFPFQPHEYSRESGTECFRFSFATFLAKSFFKSYEKRIGECAVFNPDFEDITPFINKLHSDSKPDFHKVKGFLYTILSDYKKQIPTLEKNTNDHLISTLISYMNEHKHDQISISDVASSIGYNEKYISRFINRMLNVNFTTLLSTLRADDAKSMLIETDKTMLDIAMECGYGSERTFYRHFKDMTGMTPKEYRSNKQRPATVLGNILV